LAIKTVFTKHFYIIFVFGAQLPIKIDSLGNPYLAAPFLFPYHLELLRNHLSHITSYRQILCRSLSQSLYSLLRYL